MKVSATGKNEENPANTELGAPGNTAGVRPAASAAWGSGSGTWPRAKENDLKARHLPTKGGCRGMSLAKELTKW